MLTQRFGGKLYKSYSETTTKARAEEIAKKLRAEGALARVVKRRRFHSNFYVVFYSGR